MAISPAAGNSRIKWGLHDGAGWIVQGWVDTNDAARLRAICDELAKADTIVLADITTAAGEQSDGIGQVNTAVGQLDQMTQQNAALVEQSAAAAESLKEQARKLTEVVATFRI